MAEEADYGAEEGALQEADYGEEADAEGAQQPEEHGLTAEDEPLEAPPEEALIEGSPSAESLPHASPSAESLPHQSPSAESLQHRPSDPFAFGSEFSGALAEEQHPELSPDASQGQEAAAFADAPTQVFSALSPPPVPTPQSQGGVAWMETANPSPEPEEEDDRLDDYMANSALLLQYSDAVSGAGLKRNHLVEQSLAYCQETQDEVFFIDAPGNHPLVFTSRLGDSDMEIFAAVFGPPSRHLCSLDLSYNLITDVGARHLASGLLSRGVRLHTLVLRGNAIGPSGCDAITNALRRCNKLVSLDLSLNPLGRTGGLTVIAYLAASPQLEELKIADTEIDMQVLVNAATVLLLNPSTLKLLDLSNPRIVTLQEEHTVHIGRMIGRNAHIIQLHLAKHQISDEGVRQLVSFLLENKTLLVLDLSSNRLGAAGAQHLAKLLEADCQLQYLNLESNRIGERGNADGARALAESLVRNRMLSRLNLNNNGLCGEALQVLADAIDKNATIQVLELFHSHWDQVASYKFHQILTKGARLQPLRTDFVTDEVGKQIDVCQVHGFEVGGG